jgi:hypothetical protein
VRVIVSVAIYKNNQQACEKLRRKVVTSKGIKDRRTWRRIVIINGRFGVIRGAKEKKQVTRKKQDNERTEQTGAKKEQQRRKKGTKIIQRIV